MYAPSCYRSTDPATLRGIIRTRVFGTLVSSGPAGLHATHVPFVLIDDPEPHGTLRCHIARANPQWRELDPSRQVLVTFVGADSYVSASWFESPDRLPTWAYVAAQCRGFPVVRHDPAIVRARIAELVAERESAIGGGWSMEEERDKVEHELPHVVAVDVHLTSVEGAFTLAQHRPPVDQQALRERFATGPRDVDRELAAHMRAVCPMTGPR